MPLSENRTEPSMDIESGQTLGCIQAGVVGQKGRVYNIYWFQLSNFVRIKSLPGIAGMRPRIL